MDSSDTFWDEVFEEAAASPEDTTSERIKVCYRLVRELARIKGLVDNTTKLRDGTNVSPNPWMHSLTGVQPLPNVRPEQLVRVQRACIPLFPPAEDTLLEKYLLNLDKVVRKLTIPRTYMGRKGIRFLFDPKLTRSIFPTPDVLMDWEDFFLEEFLEEQVKLGTVEGQKQMRDKYGLCPAEASRFSELSMVQSVEITRSTLEQDKAMMILQLERELFECQQGLIDRKSRIQIFKLLTFIKGLHKVEPDDTMRDIVDALHSVSSEKKRNQITTGDNEDGQSPEEN